MVRQVKSCLLWYMPELGAVIHSYKLPDNTLYSSLTSILAWQIYSIACNMLALKLVIWLLLLGVLGIVAPESKVGSLHDLYMLLFWGLHHYDSNFPRGNGYSFFLLWVWYGLKVSSANSRFPSSFWNLCGILHNARKIPQKIPNRWRKSGICCRDLLDTLKM